ncbi:MAG: hypothetical protein MUF75_05400 [Bacteroidia bacterium]|jgi:outer membrane lipoprotein-sorting protein|nr:hypothetical protein [Bacteroidia bacterium]
MKQFVLFIAISFSCFSHAQNAEDVITKINNKFNAVKDYSVNVYIQANIPMLKIMPNKGKLYFKQKDKVKIDSKGITVLPKQGFTELNSFLNEKGAYMAIFGDSVMIRGVKTKLINVIPNNSASDIILVKLWVDLQNNIILRSQLTTKSNGSINIDYSYTDQINYGLPNQLKFEIDVKKFKIPKSIAGDINKTNQQEKTTKEIDKGTITVNFTEYKVNIGLKDEIFSKN